MPPRDRQACQWGDCGLTFEDPEALFEHLADDHVGRRSTNNLCLICRWNGCGAQAAKRDHLTSHLRVHLPIKPHACAICKKAFKRPQDLKKHEKIHTLEHKASLMSNQPGYKAVRRRRKPLNDDSRQSSRATSSAPSDAIKDMMNRLNSVSDFVHKDQPVSLSSADELDAMQSWLEQLAANIETGTCIYPSSNPPSSPGDQSLYPIQQRQQPHSQPYPAAWASMLSHTGNPLTASLLDTSPFCHPPSMSSSSSSPENQPEPAYPAAPKFWTPGITADVDTQKIDGPTPSEEVDFSQPPSMTYSQPQPLHLFQTQHEEAGLLGQQKRDKSWTLEERKDVVQLLNALAAPGTNLQPGQSDSPRNTTEKETDAHDVAVAGHDNDDNDDDGQSKYSSTPSSPALSCSAKRPISLLLSKNLNDDAEDERDSPYATLINQLQNLSCEESEDEMKKRHAETVDLLWHAVNRAKTALSKKSINRLVTPNAGAPSTVL
ncbi:hypothetical protein BCR43DRAFT_507608 [Syncephalastrum racemosum]|uniref:C2H2-type domain-containing protein n=1 Tax=Syncephalastrum racemosum TaxID=13706 RepID=A0A1X2H453_SYNRA|nr:hypothetical protein BCR43DRAFT_507608 [Syncephalastrum racemosum]